MSVSRSKSLPGANGDGWDGDDSGLSRSGNSGGGRDSGVVVVASDTPSFASDARSSLLGDLPSGAACSELPSEEAENEKQGTEDPDKKATIGRHYYPEGGWGWVIVGVATAVHILTHGLHTGYGAILGITVAKFSQQATLVGRCTASRAREQQATPAQAARSGCQGRGRGRGSPSRRRAEGERFGSFGHEAECEGNVCVGKHAEEKPERVTMNSPRKHATPLRIGVFIVRVSSSNIKIILT